MGGENRIAAASALHAHPRHHPERERASHRGRVITLAIDTSTPRGAVALLRDDKPLAEQTFDRSQPKQNLFDTAAKLLSANQLGARDLGLLAVGLGPGSFTGIRGGIAAAK